MTCLTAHIFLYILRLGKEAHLVLAKQTNQPPKTLHLKRNRHHAHNVHWGVTSQFLTFRLPNRKCI